MQCTNHASRIAQSRRAAIQRGDLPPRAVRFHSTPRQLLALPCNALTASYSR